MAPAGLGEPADAVAVGQVQAAVVMVVVVLVAEQDQVAQDMAVTPLGRYCGTTGKPKGAELTHLNRPDDGWAHVALARTLERQGRDATELRRVAAPLGFEG